MPNPLLTHARMPLWIFLGPGARVSLHGRDHPALFEQSSGPLLDRIDLSVEVPAVPYKELRGKNQGAVRPKCATVWKQRGPFSTSSESPMHAYHHLGCGSSVPWTTRRKDARNGRAQDGAERTRA